MLAIILSHQWRGSDDSDGMTATTAVAAAAATTATATSSSEVYGWLAALGSALAFGTFAVPIKSQASTAVDIHPLVFQSYKTSMCLATCWLVLLIPGVKLTFSPWGVVSGLFWVPGGIATVYAIKNAGMALSLGISSSLIVLVSFSWGVFIFHEHVHRLVEALFALLCIMLGIVGMSYYSSPDSNTRPSKHDTAVTKDMEHGGHHGHVNDDHPNSDAASPHQRHQDNEVKIHHQHVSVLGMKMLTLTKRQTGIAAAMFNGIWGGSIMVPMKWSDSDDTKGFGYVISFSVGASIVCASCWVGLFLYHYFDTIRQERRHPHQQHMINNKSLVSGIMVRMGRAYNCLPPLHLRTMWRQGCLSGLIWCTGNNLSMISVSALGEGVGYPLVQTGTLVSGLWGVFYFKEVTGTARIMKWFLSSSLTIVGILLLSYEHHEA